MFESLHIINSLKNEYFSIPKLLKNISFPYQFINNFNINKNREDIKPLIFKKSS